MNKGDKVKVIEGYKKGIVGIISNVYENSRVEITYIKNEMEYKILKDQYQLIKEI
jgi:ribosomal protein L24